MNITAIIVEILIVGLVSSTWMILAALSIFGYEWVQPFFTYLQGWEALASVFFMTLCYVIGILADRAAHVVSVLLRPADFLLRFEWIRSISETAHMDDRMTLMVAENRATDFLEHISSRIRIVRSAFFNLPLMTVSLLCFLFIRGTFVHWAVYVLVIVIGLAGSFVSFMCLGVLEVTYSKRLAQALTSNRQKRHGP